VPWSFEVGRQSFYNNMFSICKGLLMHLMHGLYLYYKYSQEQVYTSTRTS
jgi:hypothetical protein